MANTHKLITATILDSNQSSVSFNSIPSTYKDLLIKISAKSTATANITTTLNISLINGSGSGLSQTYYSGTGTTVSSGRQSPQINLAGSNAGMTANTFSHAEIYIPSYADTSITKQFGIIAATENNSTTNANYYVERDANLWNNTAAITDITFVPQAGSFAANSSFYLYGISNT